MLKKIIVCIYVMLIGCLCAKVFKTDTKSPEYMRYVQTVEEKKDKAYYINVGITNDNQKTFSKVSFTCDKDYIIKTDSKQKKIRAGKKVTYASSDFNSGKKVTL